jgi:hypothetical protein
LSIDNFNLITGPDIPIAQRSRHCSFGFKAKYPVGNYYSLVKTVFRGYAEVEEGTSCAFNSVYFVDEPSTDYAVGNKSVIEGSSEWAKGVFFLFEQIVPDTAPFRSQCGTADPFGTNFNYRIAFASNSSAVGAITGGNEPFQIEIHLDWLKCRT